jgi:hypothetical protein
LSQANGAPIFRFMGKREMKRFGRTALVSLIVAAAVAPAQAAGPPVKDPNWPCQQAKVSAFPLASVWDGPPLETAAAGWRDDSQIAKLADQMSQRRVPIDEVKAAVATFAAGGERAKQKLTQAFAAAFDELVRQRAEVLAGLDRFGRKQREMADRIRAENEEAHKDAQLDPQALQKLEWDLRVFDDRRRTASYVCEAPQAIETRIGEIVRIVRAAL